MRGGNVCDLIHAARQPGKELEKECMAKTEQWERRTKPGVQHTERRRQVQREAASDSVGPWKLRREIAYHFKWEANGIS